MVHCSQWVARLLRPILLWLSKRTKKKVTSSLSLFLFFFFFGGGGRGGRGGLGGPQKNPLPKLARQASNTSQVAGAMTAILRFLKLG